MSTDGQEDFFAITGLQPAPVFPDWSAVLCNSALIATMTVQEALNASTLSWRAVVYEALEGIREFLGAGTPDCLVATMKVGLFFKEGTALCEKRSEPSGAGGRT